MLSEVAESTIGSIYLTDTGATGGNIVRAELLTLAANQCGIERTDFDTIGGSIEQSVDFGTVGDEVKIRFRHCPYRLLRKFLDAWQNASLGTVAASLKTKLLSSGGSESTLSYSALAWRNVEFPSDRPGGTITDARDVTITLRSKA